MISVLVVDDHAVVRRGTTGYLAELPDIRVVAAAAGGQEAVRLAEIHQPDVVLLDLNMPDVDGIESTTALKQVSPESRIVILTSFADDEYLFPALRAGALSYLLKSVDLDTLTQAVRSAVKGEVVLAPTVAARDGSSATK